MNFASDNTGPVHPKVMQAMMDANEGYALPYGADDLTAQACKKVAEVLEAPDASVHLVALGTAANSLIMATLCDPWSGIFCHRLAHMQEDECNAPEFFSGGAKLLLVDGPDAKICPDNLARAIEAEETRGVHGPQRGPVSITQATEKGTVYSLDEIRAICDVAHRFDLPVHMDGARFANAVAALGCSAAEMTWKAGVDAVTFGGTKNGLMAVEAAVFFDAKHGWEFELRRKRGAHLFSKQRFLAAQMLATLTDDLWLEMASASNANAARLARGLKQMPDVQLDFEPAANILWPRWARSGHTRLHEAGAQYYVMEGDPMVGDPDQILPARLVADWSADDAAVDRFLEVLRG